jgi:photosystem II stability/assembly factor-like uncharacterized protein
LPTIPPTSPFQPDAPEGWCWQEALGLVNTLNDVFFWDEQTGWAVGEKGTILHTDDGGDTWQWQDSPVDGSLEHVVFVDAQSGWISGPHRDGKSLLLQTQDGGRTWLERPVPFLGDYARPEDMIWTDAYHGWLLKYQQVFHTADGGQTWQEQPLPLEDPRLYFITSVDAQHVWLVANGSILRTTDGGATWTAHAFVPDFFAHSLAFVDAETGWAAAGNAIMHTTDGG